MPKINTWEYDDNDDYLTDYTDDNQRYSDKNVFQSLDDIHKHTTQTELDRIDRAIQTLTNTMTRYIEDVIAIWDQEFKPFIESVDCRIFRPDIDSSNYRDFLNFMCEQKTFKFMIIAYKRLLMRRKYLEVHKK